jgi:hypothetical protein
MHRDLITYRLAEGVTEARLLSVARRIIDEWMRPLPGFLGWEIHRGPDDTYTDIVSWTSAEHAQAAERAMANIPNAEEWYGCYAPRSVQGRHMERLAAFDGPAG